MLGRWATWGDRQVCLLVMLTYLALALILDAPFLFANKCLYLADLTYNVEPVVRFAREEWQRAGYLPLWNPFVLCGAPQIQILWPIAYMPCYLGLLVPFGQAIGLILLIHQMIAGVGGYLWQYLGSRAAEPAGPVMPAFLFGLAYMLSGYMVGSSLNLLLAATAAWIPLGLLLLDRMRLRPRLWCLGALGFLLGQQVTAGRPELVAVSVLLYVSYFLNSWWQSRRGFSFASGRSSAVAALFLALGLGLGFTFAAVDLVPMLELVKEAPSAGSLVTLGATFWSAGWYEFLEMLLSQPFGLLDMSTYHLYPTHPGDMPYITSLYLGAPLLTLAVFGFLRQRWKERWFWLTVAVLSALVSAGLFGALLPWLAQRLPDLLIFRFPVKVSIFLLLALAVAAAQGWRALTGSEVPERLIRSFSVLWLIVAGLGAALSLLPDASLVSLFRSTGLALATERDSLALRQLGYELLVAGLLGFLSLSAFLPQLLKRARPGFRNALWISIVSVSLMLNGARQLWQTVDASFFEPQTELAGWLIKRAGKPASEFRVLSLIGDPMLAPYAVISRARREMDQAFMQHARQVLRPNTNIDCGIRLTNGVSVIPSWNSYFLSTGLLPRSSLRPDQGHPAGKSDLPLLRWCQATSTRFVLTPQREIAKDASEARAVPQLDAHLFKLIREDPSLNLRVYEVDNARPRFSISGSYKITPDRTTALTMINRADRSGYDPNRQVLVTDLDPAHGPALPEPEVTEPVGQEPAGANCGWARLVSDRVTALIVEANVRKPAFLVVTDSFYPGWEASDNQATTKLFLADGLNRAVFLRPGKHQVVFTGKARSLFAGEVISKLMLVIFFALMATAFWRQLR